MYKWIWLIVVIHLNCFGAPEWAERQASQLSVIIQQADDAYYNKSESLMSDAAYDALKVQRARLIAAFPDLKSADSVGAELVEDAAKVEHDERVLSLGKAYSDDEVSAFVEKCGHSKFYCIEPKIDGLTIVLHYRDGMLSQAVTRGNGKAGKNVTSAILASGAVPVMLKNAPSVLDVRGEAYFMNQAFEALNKRRVSDGDSPLKSPRNSASGTLMLKNYVEVAKRGLSIQLFERLDAVELTHTETLERIQSMGLPVVPSRRVIGDDVLAAVSQLNAERAALPYHTDGIVIKLDDSALFKAMGSTAHHPRGALARKYHETPVETRLLRIEWTEKDVPIGCFEPVVIDGATIQRATLHNRNHLRAMGLQPSDLIQVIRSGGTIPEIIGRAPESLGE